MAALRLPFMALLGFVLVLVLDALMLQLAAEIRPEAISVDDFGWALLAALVMAAVSVVLAVIVGTNDDDTYTLKVVRRVAKRQGGATRTDTPGIVFLEIDGLALPVLRRAMRDGNAPNMARWLSEGSYALTEWEPDLSSQTGASQAGILLGSNHDIPSVPLGGQADRPDHRLLGARRLRGDRARAGDGHRPAHERRLQPRQPPLRRGRRGHPHGEPHLRGEEGQPRLPRVLRRTASTSRARSSCSSGRSCSRWTAALRASRRDVRPRGHRGGIYPLLRATMCVVVRDLIVYGVLTDMMRGRPAIYATFSSYDEVAHHSGLERADTLEALRKLDQQFGRIDNARRYAPRPYEIVVLSDHGQTQGATFKQRNGYGLDELVERSLAGREASIASRVATSRRRWRLALGEATGTAARSKPKKNEVGDRKVVVLGSGNLGLVYLMEEPRRLTLEEIEERHPELIPALREHPHVGWILVRSGARRARARSSGMHYLEHGRIEGDDPLAPFGPTAPHHLLRTDGFPHVADLMIGSFYDPDLDEGCAFEELISFHGGLGGPQTEPFILHPASLGVPEEEIVGAERVHAVLSGWRRQLEGRQLVIVRTPVSYSLAINRRRACGFERLLGRLGGVCRPAADDHRRAGLLPGPRSR